MSRRSHEPALRTTTSPLLSPGMSLGRSWAARRRLPGPSPPRKAWRRQSPRVASRWILSMSSIQCCCTPMPPMYVTSKPFARRRSYAALSCESPTRWILGHVPGDGSDLERPGSVPLSEAHSQPPADSRVHRHRPGRKASLAWGAAKSAKPFPGNSRSEHTHGVLQSGGAGNASLSLSYIRRGRSSYNPPARTRQTIFETKVLPACPMG
mmetsp:Transcript_90447/g.269914  ORF Transcript_90447/g.269914 Transcript_90447/m.269914 type:complete len:209 (+) Transcript_90447:496-1122(+)